MHKNPFGMKVNDRRMRRARLIRDGMSWRQACIKSGYSLATANRGPRGYLENKPGVQKDFARAAEEASYKPEFVKKAVTHRLMKAIIEGRSSDVAREAELLGKFREHDFCESHQRHLDGNFRGPCRSRESRPPRSIQR